MAHRWYSESLLASHLTVTRSTLENFRRLAGKKRRQKLAAPLSSVSRLWKNFSATWAATALDCSACLEKMALKKTLCLSWWFRACSRNPQLIQATNPATGELVLARVAKNDNFRPRMIVKVHPPEPLPAPQLYRLEGRCPRFPGNGNRCIPKSFNKSFNRPLRAVRAATHLYGSPGAGGQKRVHRSHLRSDRAHH